MPDRPATPPVEEALDDGCTCTRYVVDYSDPDRYHPENVDRELTPGCPEHDPAPPVEEAPRPTDAEIVAVMAEATCPREHLIVGGHADCLADATAMWEAAKPLLAARPVSGDVADPKRDCYGEGNACYLHDRLDCPGAVSGDTEGLREAIEDGIVDPEEIVPCPKCRAAQYVRCSPPTFGAYEPHFARRTAAVLAVVQPLLDQAAEDRAEVERLRSRLVEKDREIADLDADVQTTERAFYVVRAERDRYKAAVEAVEALTNERDDDVPHRGWVPTDRIRAALASTTERSEKGSDDD